MRVSNDLIMEAGVMDSTDTITSEALSVEHMFGATVQAVWTGTPNGTIKLQMSCDVSSPSNWTDVPSATVTVSGSAGNGVMHLKSGEYYPKWIRCSYTNTSGTGSLNLRANAKGG